MKLHNKQIILSTLFISTIVFAKEDLYEASLEDILQTETELKAEVGSRDGARNYLNSRVGIDVITYQQIQNSGATTLVETLEYFVAGFNAPATTVTDGSDHVQSFTLRGMNSGQILILINGKRVHSSALVHVNTNIGYGSNHVDLNTISLNSIQTIEVLKDGAAAQYGSDAISGVINIILKGSGYSDSMTIHIGERKKGDGRKTYIDSFISTPLKNDGFINITLSAEEQEQTQRAGADRRLDIPEVQTHAGIPESTNYNASLNAEILGILDTVIYTDTILNYKDSKASAFYRTPDSTRPIYPDGFLPIIDTKILDYSFLAGVKGESSEIKWDISNIYGVNDFNFNVEDSMNYALGESSPTSFDNGSLIFIQNTTNLDLREDIANLELAGGLEYRHENYQIKSGDEQSYSSGGYSQGFAGFRPENEVDTSRNSYAVYLNTTYNFSKIFALEGAARYENYSDFGDTSNFKLALGYKILPELFLRTSISTGFRAPSLAQSNYSHSSSFLNGDNTISTQGIFRVNHEISQSLGAKELEPEKSRHFSIGGVVEPTKNISIIFDYFYIEVDDRITLLSSVSPSTVQQQEIFDKYGVTTARYFSNLVDTKTQGIDLKLNYQYHFEDSSKLDFSFWYSTNKNVITQYDNTKLGAENIYKELDRIENGQPKESLRVLSSYQLKRVNITFNLSKYGSYRQVINDVSYKFEPAWTSDLDIAYQVDENLRISLGGTNIFDTLPNRWDGLSGIGYGYDGILPYSNYSPFGYSGAYYYLKLAIKF